MNYYKLPIKFDSILEKRDLNFCDIKESIANHIHLINTSYFGECTFDYNFGCSIWEVDFDNLKSRDKLRSLIAKSLTESLNRFEKRLSNISVEVNIRQEEVSNSKAANHVKKRVTIKIHGKIIKTNENFSYADFFYIGPLSY